MAITQHRRKKRAAAKKIMARFKRFNTKTGKLENKETKIEKITREILKGMEVAFIQERIVPHLRSYKKYDFYCWEDDSEGNRLWEFFIEVHGSYFHAKDYIKNKVSKKKLSLMQRKNVKNDNIKIMLAKKVGIPLIVFWEDTIRMRPTHVRNVLVRRIEELRAEKNTKFFYEDY